MFYCPKCHKAYETAKELEDHLNLNVGCRLHAYIELANKGIDWREYQEANRKGK